MTNYYDVISKGYNNLYGEEQIKKYAFLKDWLDSLRGTTLDIGAGTGLLNKFFKPDVLLDNSFNMLLHAKGCRVCADALNLPFKNKSFDNIISFSVLQDVKDKQRFVDEVYRVVRSKAIITLTKRGKSIEELKKLFRNFNIIEIREQEKDFCFLLKVSQHLQ